MKLSKNYKNIIRQFLAKKYAKPVLLITVFALVSTAALLITQAKDGDVSLEAETTSRSGNASFVDDDKASGGKSLHFGVVEGSGGNNSAYKPLSNPNASQQAKNVYNFLQSKEGSAILAGQHEADQCTKCESDRMQSITGKAPAVHGHDVAGYAIDPINEAINDFNVRHQIPEFSWHVSAPGTSEDWTNVQIDANVARALQSGTSENTSLVAKLNTMASRLQTLEDANVPVLWRPWHEMNGGWFWWSKSGPDTYKQLWIYTYNYFTTTKGLNNLIWVWSAAENELPNAAWYPGDQYVDITGTDTYTSNSNISNWLNNYNRHKSIAPTKPVALTETDYVPDPAQLQSSGNKMLWFLPWHSIYVDRNSQSTLTQVYNSPYVITADEMPDLRGTFQ
ncbi:hypothetical protein JNM87_06030 [Candidatus Saccharibacteria bacterium]|nr:hypothetical protein [Candidatus Saccharibacteria bacterium]